MGAGDKVRAADGVRLVARGQRTTSGSTFTTTETGFFRLDDVPVYHGKVYMLETSNMNADTNTANDVIDVKCRVKYGATAGGTAGITDTQIGHLRVKQSETTFSDVLSLNAAYIPSADGYASFLLAGQRVAGSGTEGMAFGSGAFLDVFVWEADDPGDTGVSI